MGGFRRRLETGEATLAELADGAAAGTIAPAQNERLRAEFDRAAARREAEETEIIRIGDALAEGRRLDPEDRTDRDAVDLHFSIVVEQALADLEPDARAAAFLEYGRETGIMPRSALPWVTVMPRTSV